MIDQCLDLGRTGSSCDLSLDAVRRNQRLIFERLRQTVQRDVLGSRANEDGQSAQHEHGEDDIRQREAKLQRVA